MITTRRKIVKSLPVFVRKRLPRKVTVVAISSRESKRLSRMYRRTNKPVNVLSFRYGLDYGEILVCPEVVRREAKMQGNTYKYQMTWMVIHGMIHLAGIHHEGSKKSAEIVAKLEHSILSKWPARKHKAQNSKSKTRPKDLNL